MLSGVDEQRHNSDFWQRFRLLMKGPPNSNTMGEIESVDLELAHFGQRFRLILGFAEIQTLNTMNCLTTLLLDLRSTH